MMPARRVLALAGDVPPWTAVDRAIAAGLATLYVAARLLPLRTYRPWFDEVYSLQAVHRSTAGILRFLATYDPHPPLWYLLLKGWIAIGGDSFGSLGLFAALPAIAMLIPIALIARALRLPPAAVNGVLAMTALNGYLVGSSQELRMYSLLAFLAAMSLWLLIRYANAEAARGPELYWLIAINTLIGFTQYFGWLAIGAEWLFLLVWDRRKCWWFSIGCAIVAAAMAGWLAFVLMHARSRLEAGQEAIAFSSRPTLFSVAWFYATLVGTVAVARSTTIGLALFALPVVWWAWSVRRTSSMVSGERGVLLLLAITALVPVIVAAAVSLVLPFSAWGQRHLITVALPFALLIAIAAVHLPRGVVRAGWVAIAAAWLAAASAEAIRTPYKQPAWDRLIADLRTADRGTEVPLYAVNSAAGYVAQFYLERAGEPNFRSAVVKRTAAATRGRVKPYWALEVPVVVVDDLRRLPADHFWMADDGGDDGDGAAAWGGAPVKSLLLEAGYHVGPSLDATVIVRRWNRRQIHLFPVWRTRR